MAAARPAWSDTVRPWHPDSGAHSSGWGSSNPKEAPAHRSGRPMCARHAAHSLPSAPRTSMKPGTSVSAASHHAAPPEAACQRGSCRPAARRIGPFGAGSLLLGAADNDSRRNLALRNRGPGASGAASCWSQGASPAAHTSGRQATRSVRTSPSATSGSAPSDTAPTASGSTTTAAPPRSREACATDLSDRCSLV